LYTSSALPRLQWLVTVVAPTEIFEPFRAARQAEPQKPTAASIRDASKKK
jgi:hypothetical protein